MTLPIRIMRSYLGRREAKPNEQRPPDGIVDPESMGLPKATKKRGGKKLCE